MIATKFSYGGLRQTLEERPFAEDELRELSVKEEYDEIYDLLVRECDRYIAGSQESDYVYQANGILSSAFELIELFGIVIPRSHFTNYEERIDILRANVNEAKKNVSLRLGGAN